MILKLIGMKKHVKTARKFLKSKRKEENLALPDAIRKLHVLGEKEAPGLQALVCCVHNHTQNTEQCLGSQLMLLLGEWIKDD